MVIVQNAYMHKHINTKRPDMSGGYSIRPMPIDRLMTFSTCIGSQTKRIRYTGVALQTLFQSPIHGSGARGSFRVPRSH
jgi:hypothetical protein